MTQKFKFLLFAIVTVAFFTACSDDDDDKKEKNRLPETARAFIESRLPGYSILSISEVDDKGDEGNEKYVATLTNDIVISFSSMGYWRRIESSSELPEKVQDELSYNGADKVKEKYPSKTINKMYFLPYFRKVVLNDDTSLIVYTDNGTNMKVGIDLHGDLRVNQKIYDFLTSYYATPGSGLTYEFFQEDEVDGSGYRFFVSNGQKAYFDKDGEWYYSDGASSSVPGKMYAGVLPQELRSIIENKYKGSATSVHRIIFHKTYYQVLLKIDSASPAAFFILYDMATKAEIEPPIQTMIDFLKTYVYEGEYYPDMIFTYKIKEDHKKAVYQFLGSQGSTEIVAITMGLDGRMYSVTLNGAGISRKILDYLPTKVKVYVEENVSSEDKIISVVNGVGDEYYIQFYSGRLIFDKDGNVQK